MPLRSSASISPAWVATTGLVAATFLALAPAGCGNAKQTDAATLAPGGVRRACDARKSWQHAIRRECTTCIAKAITPKCTSCNVKEYSGVCSEQEKARRDEASCGDVAKCVFHCKDDDCDCIDKCYAGKEACEKLAGVVDECTNKACDASCR